MSKLNNFADLAKMVAKFRSINPNGYIRVECDSNIADGTKAVRFAASAVPEKGFTVDILIPCEDYNEAVGELVTNVPLMFGLPADSEPDTEKPARRRKSVPQSSASVPASDSNTQAAEAVATPRRRRRAQDTFTAEQLASLYMPDVVSDERDNAQITFFSPTPPAEEEKCADERPATVPADALVTTQPVIEAVSPVAKQPVQETAPTVEQSNTQPQQPSTPPSSQQGPTVETIQQTGSIPPVSEDEELEKALGYVIPGRLMNAGLTLSELIEKLDKEQYVRELNWFAYSYRGHDIGLKKAAVRVLKFIKETA